MELKKYFVVKNYILKREDKIDTYGDVFQWWVDPQHNGSNHGRRFINFKEKDVKSTSDNKLDLVTVGDLVEKDNDWEILKVIRFNMDGNMVCLIHTSSNIEEYEINEYRKKFITAIYKRQSNGDYKRYEVKE